MAATGFPSIILSFLLLLSSASGRLPPPSQDPSSLDPSLQQTPKIIHEACKAARDPPACESWLSSQGHVTPTATVLEVIRSALGIASRNLDKGRSMIHDILRSAGGNANKTRAANNCLEVVSYADHRLNLTAGEAIPAKALKDGRAWLSAALSYQYDCWSALKYVNDTAQVVQTMEFFNSTMIAGSSRALAMLMNYDIYGDKTASWAPPKTERVGFWEPAGGGSAAPPGGVPPGLEEDVTVCKNSAAAACEYNSIQEAVNAAPNFAKRFVIRIRAGVYDETVRIPLEKTNVVFLGDGRGKTVITGSRNVGQKGITTFDTATVGVVGDGFMATGITFKNTAGPVAHQAVAFRSDSDRSIIENCEFLGNQDTLYAHSLRQLYKSCLIQGNVDFIFGNAAAVFENCLILIAPRQESPEKGETNAVTAHGRVDPGQSTGFVFRNSIINGTEEYNELYRKNPRVHRNFLGRPWKEYSRTVFIACTLEALISADGWLPWSGDFALKTLYYSEFNNTGPGSNTEKRVPWSSRIPAEHAGYYSVENFIQGDQWIGK
ncbi:probable pectinesterase/pectinesterase inhibitor 51 [Andrographis paniculata]|uniref:probable pectinesterase/pectinesterase inhibitor 51 n=1 Tax=Andrographis paniculata TaxID=175694 RepID=UPI0021E9413F|nr:probable pectinesterase/pectinesterase inhibitor 51 [Andrographis paniculata]